MIDGQKAIEKVEAIREKLPYYQMRYALIPWNEANQLEQLIDDMLEDLKRITKGDV